MNQHLTKEALKEKSESPTKPQDSLNSQNPRQSKKTTATKAWVVQRVLKRLDVYEKDVKLIFEEVLKVITEQLQEGNEVMFRGFGTFVVAKTKPRPSPYARGGITKPSKKIRFRQSKAIEL